MYQAKIKRYQKKFDYSYAFGAYPVLDLLSNYPDKAIKILLKEGTDGSEGIQEIKGICEKENIPFEYANRLIDKIAVKENTYVVGVFRKYEVELHGDTNHLVLVNPTNMGNLGTIVRAMLGFGFTDLVIIKPAVDIFDPLVIRSTMGAIFKIRFKYFEDFDSYYKKYPNHNLYPFMLDGAKDIKEVSFKEPFSLIHGNESEGLPKEFKDLGESVYIPHSKEIDSLNLSVATAISLWEVSKKK